MTDKKDKMKKLDEPKEEKSVFDQLAMFKSKTIKRRHSDAILNYLKLSENEKPPEPLKNNFMVKK
jgi:hypothetical protein